MSLCHTDRPSHTLSSHRRHDREGSRPFYHDPIWDAEQDSWSHEPHITMGASLGTVADFSGAVTAGCFCQTGG